MITVDQLLFTLALLAALGCGLMAGTFFAFSVVVMKALVRIPAGAGIPAMQAINVAAVNTWFLTVFLGTATLCALALISAALWWGAPGTACLVAGSVLYLVGTLWVTLACNVPRNETLAKAPSTDPESAGMWARFVPGWTAWNHVRTVAALAAAAAFSVALGKIGPGIF